MSRVRLSLSLQEELCVRSFTKVGLTNQIGCPGDMLYVPFLGGKCVPVSLCINTTHCVFFMLRYKGGNSAQPHTDVHAFSSIINKEKLIISALPTFLIGNLWLIPLDV